MTEHQYDLVAIGGGTAGLVSAVGGNYIGARTAMVEKEALGGDCLWTGCVPSKAVIASARLAHAMRHAGALGLRSAAPSHAFGEVMERMRAARGRVAHHDDPERFRSMGVAVHLGNARFLEPGVIEVEGVGRIRSKRFVVATGARPAVPPIPGLAEAGFLTYETVFDQDSLPKRIVVLGAGPVGLELAQVYARLGARVTVVEMADDILPNEDPDVAAALRDLLTAEGIDFALGSAAAKVEVTDSVTTVQTEKGGRFETDEILVAVGRRPATEGLDLDRAGIETEGPAVRVDGKLSTTGKGVWAAGDVTGGLQFTHVADYMAKKVVRNALLPLAASVDYSVVPRVTFTDPEVAHVGLGEAEALARGGTVHRFDFGELDRAIVDATTSGFVKVTADRRGRILGATVLAHGAGELLMPVVMAMKHGISLGAVTDTIFPYPTMTEGFLRAAQEYRRGQIDSLGGRVLRKVVSWLA